MACNLRKPFSGYKAEGTTRGFEKEQKVENCSNDLAFEHDIHAYDVFYMQQNKKC